MLDKIWTGYTHIANGIGKEDLPPEPIDREERDDETSSADSAGGPRSCLVFF
jgi:hypothetical protein